MEVKQVTFECNKFHLNIENNSARFGYTLISITTEQAQELYLQYSKIFSTSAKMEMNRQIGIS